MSRDMVPDESSRFCSTRWRVAAARARRGFLNERTNPDPQTAENPSPRDTPHPESFPGGVQAP